MAGIELFLCGRTCRIRRPSHETPRGKLTTLLAVAGPKSGQAARPASEDDGAAGVRRTPSGRAIEQSHGPGHAKARGSKLFTAGADEAQILDMANQPWIAGFTTSPWLLKKTGVRDYEAHARDLVAGVPDRDDLLPHGASSKMPTADCFRQHPPAECRTLTTLLIRCPSAASSVAHANSSTLW